MPIGFEGPLAGYLEVQDNIQNQELVRQQILQTQALAKQQASSTAFNEANTQKVLYDIESDKQKKADARSKAAAIQRLWALSQGPAGVPSPGMSGAPTGPPGSNVERLDADLSRKIEYVNSLADNGYITEAQEASKDLSKVAANLSVVRKNQTDDKIKNIEGGVKVATTVNNLMLGVKDQGSFDRAKIQFLSMFPGSPPPPFFNLPYDTAKPFLSQIQKTSVEAIDRNSKLAQTAKESSQAEQARQSANLERLRIQLHEMEVKAAQAAQAAAEKAGQLPPSVLRPGSNVQTNDNDGGKPYMGERRIVNMTGPQKHTAQRLVTAANELYTGFDEILAMPAGSLGTFQDLAEHKDPTVIGGIKKWAANKITSDESHMYAARLAGVSVAAAILASVGSAPRVSQIVAEQAAVTQLAGQSRLVFFDRIHQASLKAYRALETVEAGSAQSAENLDLVQNRLKEVIERTDKILVNMGQKPKHSLTRDKSTDTAGGNNNNGAPVTIASQEEYNKLPSGTKFTWNGKSYTKE